MKFKYLMFAGFALICLLLGGCGHVKNAKQLHKYANRTYGKCKMVSKTETEEKTEIVLIDELQGFEYKVVSQMGDINIDGTSFGSLPSTSDTFSKSLKEYVLSEVRPDIDKLCSNYNATYDPTYDALGKFTLTSPNTEANGVSLVEAAGKLFQDYNLEHRMDKMTLSVEYDDKWYDENYTHKDTGNAEEDYMYSGADKSELKHIGSVKLPNCIFRDKETETVDLFIENAQCISSKSKYLRKETKPFSETGISLDRVAQTYYNPYPKSMSDTVTFYYFEVEGKEYYICDFEDAETYSWYTNYKDVFPKS